MAQVYFRRFYEQVEASRMIPDKGIRRSLKRSAKGWMNLYIQTHWPTNKKLQGWLLPGA